MYHMMARLDDFLSIFDFFQIIHNLVQISVYNMVPQWYPHSIVTHIVSQQYQDSIPDAFSQYHLVFLRYFHNILIIFHIVINIRFSPIILQSVPKFKVYTSLATIAESGVKNLKTNFGRNLAKYHFLLEFTIKYYRLACFFCNTLCNIQMHAHCTTFKRKYMRQYKILVWHVIFMHI